MQRREPKKGSLRANIWEWLRHFGPYGDVLEIGSRRSVEGCWWANNKLACDGLYEEWTGVDMQDGIGVDHVVDLTEDDSEFIQHNVAGFDTIIAAEVFEHVYDIHGLVENCNILLRPGGKIVVTTMFAFFEHGYPEDYWRFTRTCLERLLDDHGFHNIQSGYASHHVDEWRDHCDQVARRDIHRQVRAYGEKR